MRRTRELANWPSRRTNRVATGLALTLSAALVLGACGDGDDDGSGTGPGRSEVTAEPVVGARDVNFDPERVTVPAGEQVTLTFENHDDGVMHNFHLDAPGDPATDVFAGPGERQLELQVEEGEYEFRCDVHSQMSGALVAAP